jgi:hypothetical protein
VVVVVCGVWCVDVDVSAIEWIEIRDFETRECKAATAKIITKKVAEKKNGGTAGCRPCLVELVCERARSMQAQQERPARTEEGWNHLRGIVYPKCQTP